MPTDQELTTQEAADLLGVSLPFFIEKVLEAGKLPFYYLGKHRRIRLDDLLKFQQRDLAEREAIAAQLTWESQELEAEKKIYSHIYGHLPTFLFFCISGFRIVSCVFMG